MNPDTALLPLCIAIGVLGLILAVLLWVRDRRGRAVQALGFAALPVGLYLTGLLRMIWDAVVAVIRWAGSVVFNTTIWTGFGLIALAVVLWIVGGMIASRNRTRRAVEKARGAEQPGGRPAVGRGTRGAAAGGASGAAGAAGAAGASGATGSTVAGKQSGTPARGGNKQAAESDPEMDEIEAILKNRGIE
ncbi:hypothetical protein CGZ96_06180 [Enemella evansiae]|uniref:hypothetical protein n=1 Tax=Enemella evansiae TaxID=2016499 RepID=UPI000B972B0F|nr:hypothetical protein [Enemella evansiae]OYN99689.1 hypothetical protein CGZ96_06180 [Enemella evansiae]